jgi:6-phosphogluconate dehydrogenase
MELGFVGLGRMGGNMVTRLVRGGHRIVAYDPSPGAASLAKANGAELTASLAELPKALRPPRAVWVMVPAGEPTETAIQTLAGVLERGDTIVDGGNTKWKDDVRRGKELAARGVHYVDVGTSGGIWGLENGYCLMVGGEEAPVKRLTPIFATLAPPDGWLHVGGIGAGHYVKMIHNGIEYAMMQGYAEGFELMSASEYRLDLPAIAKLWNQGSVVRSWLLELCESAFAKDPELASIKGYVEDSGEGRWTAEEAIERNVPAPVLMLSLFARFASRQGSSFSAKVIAALRNEFGGHAVRKE